MGKNHTSCPRELRIMAPDCVAPYAVRKKSPEVVSRAPLVPTAGGWRSGPERKAWVRPDDWASAGRAARRAPTAAPEPPEDTAIPNQKSIVLVPRAPEAVPAATEVRAAVTSTRSPG